METFLELLPVLAAPFSACIVLIGIHCYLGIHVVHRGVIFVDLSLAQIAAFGSVVALFFGFELDSLGAYFISLGFTFVGAAIFSFWRYSEKGIPQEALIGIAYAVASAASIMVLSHSPHGHEEIKTMMVGSILYVGWADVLKILLLYSLIGVVHYFLRHKFFAITKSHTEAEKQGINVPVWDFVFYMTFGFVVTSSVKIGGVLLVFSYLVVPAVIAIIFHQGPASRLFFGWFVGLVVTVLGFTVALIWDYPIGASIVAMFGLVLLLITLTQQALKIFYRQR
jgi:zinc/manganese transport system permease protein